jgi:hypothetical protein
MYYEFEHEAESVYTLLTDPDFLVERCLQLGELEASCDVEEKSDMTVVKLTRKLESDLPRFLAKIMGPVQTMHITEHWRSDNENGWGGEYTFEIEGQPVSISAKFELYPTDSGSCYSIEHHVSAKVPLIGRKLEKFIHTQAEQGCSAELDYLRERLG